MALYIPSLEKVQLGLETIWGDLAVPTVELVGISNCKITPKVEASQIIDKRGSTMPAYIATVNQLSAEATIEGVVAYSHFRYWLDGLFGIDPAAPYAYLAELVPTLRPQSFNLVYGQPDVTYSAGGLTMDGLTVKGSYNGPLTFSAHLAGKGVVDDTLEVLAPDDVVIAMGNHCALYIDPIAGPIGNTPVLVTAFSFEWAPTVDRKLTWHLGALNPDNFRHGKWGGSLRLVLEMTSDMQDILDAAWAQEVSPGGYAVRIVATDSLTTSVLTLDMAGHLLALPAMFTDAEGVTTFEMSLVPVYSSDATFLSCWGAGLALP